jgi:hypothetical protein
MALSAGFGRCEQLFVAMRSSFKDAFRKLTFAGSAGRCKLPWPWIDLDKALRGKPERLTQRLFDNLAVVDRPLDPARARDIAVGSAVQRSFRATSIALGSSQSTRVITDATAGVHGGARKHGVGEGRNDRVPALAADLISRRPYVIMVGSRRRGCVRPSKWQWHHHGS